MLPTTEDDCPIPSRSCFDSGSENVNLLPTNVALHTIWFRQHNRLADELKELNPHWEDEKLFQESRRILGAQIQHITYGEFLPILIGTENMQKYGVELKATDYYSDYDMSINPNTMNVFAGAVGFLQWSMLPDRFGKYKKSGFLNENRLLSDYFYATDDLLDRDALDGFVR